MDMRNEIHVENLIYLSFRKTNKTRQGLIGNKLKLLYLI